MIKPGKSQGPSERSTSIFSTRGPGPLLILILRCTAVHVKDMDELCKQAQIGPFSSIRPQIYFKDFGEKSSRKQICRDGWISAVVDGNQEA